MAGHWQIKGGWKIKYVYIFYICIYNTAARVFSAHLFMCPFLTNNCPFVLCRVWTAVSRRLITCTGLTCMCRAVPSWSYSISSRSETVATATGQCVQSTLWGGSHALVHVKHLLHAAVAEGWFRGSPKGQNTAFNVSHSLPPHSLLNCALQKELGRETLKSNGFSRAQQVPL